MGKEGGREEGKEGGREGRKGRKGGGKEGGREFRVLKQGSKRCIDGEREKKRMGVFYFISTHSLLPLLSYPFFPSLF